MKSIELGKIRTDGGTQMRAELSREVYMDYRDKWTAGEQFPPVVLFNDGSCYWLADGFHRFYGAREAKLDKIPADVRQGTVRDAILFAVAANQQHGLRRTNADKRRAVEALLGDEEWAKWSNVKIAEAAGVSDPFVKSIRDQLLTVRGCDTTEPSPRIGKDGKARKSPEKKSTKPVPLERNRIIPVPDDDEEDDEPDEPDEPTKPSGSIAPCFVPLLDAQKAADEIFAPLNKAEREELFEYIEFRYGPKP